MFFLQVTSLLFSVTFKFPDILKRVGSALLKINNIATPIENAEEFRYNAGTSFSEICLILRLVENNRTAGFEVATYSPFL